MSTNGSRDVPALTGFRTAESRWARLGPYYAMFPIEFARQVVEAFSKHGDMVLDPFCGRGTAPYVAMVSGRGAAGCDINPVAWLYAAVKTDPHPSLADVIRRIDEIGRAVRERDCRPADEFQELAFRAEGARVHQRRPPRTAVARQRPRSHYRGAASPLPTRQAGAGPLESVAPDEGDVPRLFCPLVAEAWTHYSAGHRRSRLPTPSRGLALREGRAGTCGQRLCRGIRMTPETCTLFSFLRPPMLGASAFTSSPSWISHPTDVHSTARSASKSVR